MAQMRVIVAPSSLVGPVIDPVTAIGGHGQADALGFGDGFPQGPDPIEAGRPVSAGTISFLRSEGNFSDAGKVATGTHPLDIDTDGTERSRGRRQPIAAMRQGDENFPFGRLFVRMVRNNDWAAGIGRPNPAF